MSAWLATGELALDVLLHRDEGAVPRAIIVHERTRDCCRLPHESLIAAGDLALDEERQRRVGERESARGCRHVRYLLDWRQMFCLRHRPKFTAADRYCANTMMRDAAHATRLARRVGEE